MATNEIARGKTKDIGSKWTSQWGLTNVDVSERDGKLRVHADLPGVKRDELRVHVRDNALVITAEHSTAHREEQEGMWYSERTYGSFERSIPMPRGIDVSKVHAHFADGMLDVELALPETIEGRRIDTREPDAKEVPISVKKAD